MNTQITQLQCTCQAAPKLIFPCSGASDVSGLSDRAARQMTLDLAGKMYCLAGIGGRVEGIVANTRAAAKVLVIDGCQEECARKTMESAGFSPDISHLCRQDRAPVARSAGCQPAVSPTGSRQDVRVATAACRWETGPTTGFAPCRQVRL